MHNFQYPSHVRKARRKTWMCSKITYLRRESSDEGWDSKIGEDAPRECALSNDFNAIVETNMSSKRAIEGIITNHPKWVGGCWFSQSSYCNYQRNVPRFLRRLHTAQPPSTFCVDKMRLRGSTWRMDQPLTRTTSSGTTAPSSPV